MASTATAFTVGNRVRVAYSTTPSDYMEGSITAFTSTSLTVNVDYVGGTGTWASWNITVAGAVGSTGATGATGVQGITGLPDRQGERVHGDAGNTGY